MSNAKDPYDLVEHAIFVLQPDRSGVPRYAGMNRFALGLVGKTLCDVVGKTAIEVYPGRLGKIAYEQHEAALSATTPRSYEILLPFGDGQRRVRTVLTPDLDDQNKIVRLIGSSTDISGNQLLSEMQAGASTLNSEMEDFINLAAHDLRAPMQNVSTIADMLREDFQDMGDGKLELIDMLEDIGTKAMELIGDVLAHAQASSSVMGVTQFDLADLLREIMGLLDPMEQCKISINAGVIEGDRTATQIILRNLVDNAIKYALRCADEVDNSEVTRLHLTISLRDLDGLFEVSVKDNGLGFSDSSILFLSGGQLFADSGFGMLGVRRLIHARGGTLAAANAPDRDGAIVTFALPGRVCTEPLAKSA